MINESSLISGPSNCIRIEGNGKVLYLYLFAFFPVVKECSDPGAKYISQYLQKSIKKTKKDLDIFIQVPPLKESESDKSPTRLQTKNYGEELIEFFNDHHKKTNKARTHFYDVMYLVHFISHDIIAINDSIMNLGSCIIGNKIIDMNAILNMAQYIHDDINNFKILLTKPDKLNSNNLNDNYKNLIRYFKKLDKFKHKNKDVVYLYEYLLSLLDEISDHLDKIVDNVNNIRKLPSSEFETRVSKIHFSFGPKFNELVDDSMSNVNELGLKYDMFTTMIGDLYFIRRFLDKSYVKNGIVIGTFYGLLHILYHLVKYHGFKITNMTNQSENIEKINEKINTITYKNFTVTPLIFETMPKVLAQCIDMKGMPSDFS